jgi:hypothetical protein
MRIASILEHIGLGCLAFSSAFLIVFGPYLAVLLLVVAVEFEFDGPSIEQGEQRAQPLIQALYAYRQDTGRHPADIHQLVPSYLAQVPKPGWRFYYTYDPCADGPGYRVEFQIRAAGGECAYISSVQTWRCHESMKPTGLACEMQ